MNHDETADDERVGLLRAAIDEGIAELDAGRGREMSIEELMAAVRSEADIDVGPQLVVSRLPATNFTPAGFAAHAVFS